MPKSNMPYEDRSVKSQYVYRRNLRVQQAQAEVERVGDNAYARRQVVVNQVAEDRGPMQQNDQDLMRADVPHVPVPPAAEREGHNQRNEDAEPIASSDDEVDNDPNQADDHGSEGGDDDLEVDDDDGDNMPGLAPNAPLYEGAPVTVQDAMLLLLHVQMKNNISNSCVSELLHVMNLICPRHNLKTLSLYKYHKFFNHRSAPINKHYYCSVCFSGLDSPQAVCAVCDDRRGVSYFVQMSLAPQLRELFKRNTFYDDLQLRFNRNRNEPGALCDIYDGSVYQEQIQNGFLSDPNHISLLWYTDGVPVFASRKYSIWPFLFVINELPYKKRVKRENTLLAGLWFGPNKPEANLFMRSFLPDLRDLYRGIPVTVPNIQHQILLRGVVLAGVCDVPAKSTFLNIIAHSGFYGCTVCEIRGETLQRAGDTDKHVYRFEAEMTLRTVARFQEQSRLAVRADVPVHGVKGSTVLRLFMPDFLKGSAIDPMHLVTGVSKKLLKLHFSEKCSGLPCSVRPVLGVADLELMNIKPPKFIHRKPSSLEYFNRWKASEIMAWLMYYSLPIYKAILLPEYFNHYLKFVLAISYLSGSVVRPHDIDLAEQLLNEFVRDFEDLYGLKFCSINIHLLRHLPLCVRNLGPLWAYTCFPMENINGLLLATLHGKSSIDSQLCNMFWHGLKAQRKVDAVNSEEIRDFLNKRKRSLHIGEQVAPSCYVVGLEKSDRQIHPAIVNGLEASNVPVGRIKLYSRLLKDSLIYTSEMYNRDIGSNSRYVMYSFQNENRIGSIVSFVKVFRCNCNNLCPCFKEHYAIMRPLQVVESFTLPQYRDCSLYHIHKYVPTLEVVAVPVKSLQTVCVFMSVFNAVYVARPINSYEVE